MGYAEARFVCKCECGGDVLGVPQFGKLWTWCTECTPVTNVKFPAVKPVKEKHVDETLKFKMGATVRLAETDESGTVIGRAEYVNAEPTYLVRYCAADGRQVEAWWSEDALVSSI